MVELRGLQFPPIMNASGARGFFGEGYWYHAPWKALGLSFRGCGFVAKTVTLEPRIGNMPMKPDGITPKEWLLKCIITKPIKGIVLNSVGLSNPGAATFVAWLRWHTLSATNMPWFLSFMSVQKTLDEKLQELREFVRMLLPTIHAFNIPAGLEINFSCPNVGLKMNTHHESLSEEIWLSLEIAGRLGVPVQVKLNALAPIPDIYEAAMHPACDAIVMGNTIPWGMFPDRINWKQLFGSDISPLTHLGGGGLSGPPLRPIHCEWIRNARQYGITKPIWGCGGVDSPDAVDEYARAGTNGIQFGTVCMLRPWQVQPIRRRAYELFSQPA